MVSAHHPTRPHPSGLPYRVGVGVMLLNAHNHVMVGQRIDSTLEAWQMPQGGIDKGEAPLIAAFREMEEEIGTAKAELLAETPDWLYYDLPEDLIGKLWKGKYCGQRQKWFAMRFTGEDRDINLDTEHPEFRAWKWAPVRELSDIIVPFKRPLYTEILAAFRHITG